MATGDDYQRQLGLFGPPSAEPDAKRQAPSAKRQAPSAKRQAPSAKRQAPSAKRQAKRQAPERQSARAPERQSALLRVPNHLACQAIPAGENSPPFSLSNTERWASTANGRRNDLACQVIPAPRGGFSERAVVGARVPSPERAVVGARVPSPERAVVGARVPSPERAVVGARPGKGAVVLARIVASGSGSARP